MEARLFVPLIDADSAKAYLARLFSGSRKVQMTRVDHRETFDVEFVVSDGSSSGGNDPITRYVGRKPQVIWTLAVPDREGGSVIRHRVRITGPSVAIVGSTDRLTGKETIHRVLVCVSQDQIAEASVEAERMAQAS